MEVLQENHGLIAPPSLQHEGGRGSERKVRELSGKF